MRCPRMPIYLDYHATTPIDPRVLRVLDPWQTYHFGNPASAHVFGQEAARAVEEARAHVAAMVQADPDEVIFTSGATESNNLALKGVAEVFQGRRDHIVVSPIEHSSVVACVRYLEAHGWRVTTLPIGPSGVVDPRAVEAAITPRTAIVSVMSANNEIGTVQPLAAISLACRARGVVFHSDACQGFGRVNLQLCPVGERCEPVADLISLSGHKLYGPKGIGALIVRKGTTFAPQMLGGTHEHGLRAGTPNVPGIVGLGAACEIMAAEWADEAQRLGALRDELLARLSARLGGRLVVNGSMRPEERLPQNLNVTVRGTDHRVIEREVAPRVAISGSSACTSGAPSTSKVIAAIGGVPLEHGATLRVGFGRFSERGDAEEAAAAILGAVAASDASRAG